MPSFYIWRIITIEKRQHSIRLVGWSIGRTCIGWFCWREVKKKLKTIEMYTKLEKKTKFLMTILNKPAMYNDRVYCTKYIVVSTDAILLLLFFMPHFSKRWNTLRPFLVICNTYIKYMFSAWCIWWRLQEHGALSLSIHLTTQLNSKLEDEKKN